MSKNEIEDAITVLCRNSVALADKAACSDNYDAALKFSQAADNCMRAGMMLAEMQKSRDDQFAPQRHGEKP